MKDLEKLYLSIQQKGDYLNLLRLQRFLGEPYELEYVKNVLDSYHFSDGSWDYQSAKDENNRIGSLGGTIHCLRWLREFELHSSPQMISTLRFLSSIQGSDGSFYETEEKLAHSPQKWLQEETDIDRFYFTAAVPMRLFSLGYFDHPIIASALEWLQHHWINWDVIARTWYGPWALLCVFYGIEQQKTQLYQRCYQFSLNWLPRLKAQPLTWLLDALYGAGFTLRDPLVIKGLDRLENLRTEDGIWLDTEYSTIETTITALLLLKYFERLSP